MKHIGMIVLSHYPQDVRVRREAEALAAEPHGRAVGNDNRRAGLVGRDHVLGPLAVVPLFEPQDAVAVSESRYDVAPPVAAVTDWPRGHRPQKKPEL